MVFMSSQWAPLLLGPAIAGQFFDDLRGQLDDEKLEELMWAAINKGNRRKE